MEYSTLFLKVTGENVNEIDFTIINQNGHNPLVKTNFTIEYNSKFYYIYIFFIIIF